MSIKNKERYFLKGGGKMGELIRAKDWTKTTLGDPASWPQSLRITLGIILNSKFPMFLWWGEQLISFYNDAYRPSLGKDGKHPSILGMPAKDAWPEIWEIIHPLIKKVINEGEAIWFEDKLVPIYRNGKVEEVYWTFSYSPVPDEEDNVAGVLVTCTETTEKVTSLRRIEESEQRFRNTLKQAPVGITILRGPQYIVEMVNDTYLQLVDKKESDLIGNPLFDALPEVEEAVHLLLDNVLNTGIPYHGCEVPIPLNRYGKQDLFYFDFLYHPLREENGTISGVIVSATEVTDKVESRKKIEESDEKLKSLIESAPFPIGVFTGKEMRIDLANESIIKAWGKGNEVKGKLFKELMPEVESQHIFEQLEEVFTSGIPYHAVNRYLEIIVDGKARPYYYNYSFMPLFDSSGKVYGVMNTAADVTELNLAKERIEESEQDLRSMALQAPIGICILDASTLISEIVNDSFIEIAGKSRDEITGRFYWDTFAQARNSYESALQKVVTEGEPFFANETELTLIRHGKEEIIYVTFVYAPLKDDDGNVKKVAVWVLDNTQQVIARRKIEEDTEKLNIVIDASELGTWEFNLLTKEATYSKRYLEILGGYKEEIKLDHSQLIKHLHPDDLPIREQAFKEAFITGYLQYEARLIWNDKSIHWMEGKGKVFYDEEKKPVKLIGTIRDITERKNQEEELKKSEEQFSTLADNMENLAWLADGEGSIYWYNKRWLEYTGLTLEEMQGWGWQKVHHPEHVEHIIEVSKKLWHINESFELTFPLRRHDGEFRWFLTRGYPVANEKGEIIRWIGTNTDINEQKKAEEQFKVLADQAPMWVWLTDKEVNVLYSNPELLKFLGIAHYMEFTGNMWEEKVHKEDIAMVYKSFGDAVSLQQSFSFEFRVLNASTQKYEWFYIKAVPRLEGGEFTGFIGTGININEQKLILSQLEYRKALLEAHNEASIDGILLVDTKGKILSYNHRFVKIWNMPQHIMDDNDDEAALEFALTKLVNPEQFIEKVKWLYEHSDEISIDELEFIDGKIIERFGYPVAAADGSYYAWSWMFRDITEQRKSERTIKESEEKFRLLADSMPQHIWTSDPQGNLNYFNKSVFDYTGLTLDQITKNGWLQIVHPDDRAENINQWANAIASGNDFLLEHRFRRHDGEYRWQLSRAIPQKDQNGEIHMWVGTSTDIQNQKMFAEELEKQVAERTKALAETNIELEKMNKELQSFAYISSHDLQEPLRKIQTFSSQILDKESQNLSASVMEKFGRMQNAAKRMQTLIDDLLTYSRTSTAERKFEMSDLNSIVEEVKEDLKEELQQKNAIIEVNEIGEASIIPFQFRQLLFNLVSNSLKFSSPNLPPLIQIKGEMANGVNLNYEKLVADELYCHIRVSDNGIGLEDQYKERIFEVFQRLHGKNEYNGTGIGLAIVKRIVENHNGFITAKGELNKGTTFDIYFPAIR